MAYKLKTIQGKIIGGYALMAMLLILMGGIVFEKLQEVAHLSARIEHQRVPALIVAKNMKSNLERVLADLRGYLLVPKEDFSKSRYKIWQEQLIPNTKKLINILQSFEDIDVVNNLQKTQKDLSRLEEEQNNVEKLARNGNKEAAILSLDTNCLPLAASLQNNLEEIIEAQKTIMYQEIRQQGSLENKLKTAMIIILLFGTIASILLGVLLGRNIKNLLVAETNKLQKSSDDLRNTSSDHLNSITEQTAVTNELSTTVKELSEQLKAVFERCKELSKRVNSVTERCIKSTNAVENTQEVMQKIKQQIETVVKLMNDFNSKSQQINLAVEIIQELSEQTTILSYNAAIEAAAAGEKGKSFAVVAEQVGKLAERAKEASKDVKAIISEINNASSATIAATQSALQAADQGGTIQQEASNLILNVQQDMQQSLEAVREIETANEQQAAAAEQVKLAIEDILMSAKNLQENSRLVLATAEVISETSENLERI